MLCLALSLFTIFATAAPTKSQYLAQLEEYHTSDSNRALARAWELLEYYWGQLFLAQDQVYLLQLPAELNETQGRMLVSRLDRLGWRGSLRHVRVTNATCSVSDNRCRCLCHAVDGFTLGTHFLGVPNQALLVQGPNDPDRTYLRVYTGTNHILHTQPSERRWNSTARKEEPENPYIDGYVLEYTRYGGRFVSQRENRLKQQLLADCERLTPRDLEPMQLLFLDTFPDPAESV